MKKIKCKNIVKLFVIVLVSSCSPFSKELYLQQYNTEVKSDSPTYTEEDWVKSEIKFKRFSEEWYTKFEGELTRKEQVLIAKHSLQHNILKSKNGIIDICNLFIKKYYENLKRQLSDYSESDMKENIECLIRQADEFGEEAVNLIQDIYDELDINIEDFEN